MAKSKAQLEAENRLLRDNAQSNAVASVLRDVAKWAALGFIAYCAYLSVASLAGRSTNADIVVNVLSDIRISQALAWLLAAGGISYGRVQRRLKKGTVERLQGRIKELETRVDPKRSSSGLTVRGDTNPEDIQ